MTWSWELLSDDGGLKLMIMKPIIEKTKIDGCLIIRPHLFSDSRGTFSVPYNKDFFDDLLPGTRFIQDNQSYSTKGVIRGIHYQKYPYGQGKLVRCAYGCVRDVIVDIRIESITYGQHITVDLSHQNGIMVWIPSGLGHGFSVLSDEAIFEYKVDDDYNASAEDGIRWNDPTLNIDWGVDIPILSDKDLQLNYFK
jgi:dTDP-4-dehydrorhamnose 3,5-epimerase